MDRVLSVPSHCLDGKKIDPKHATPKSKSKANKTKKIFVGGVSQETSAEEVKAYFNQFGEFDIPGPGEVLVKGADLSMELYLLSIITFNIQSTIAAVFPHLSPRQSFPSEVRWRWEVSELNSEILQTSLRSGDNNIPSAR